jgi:hypothetical protein
MTRHAPRVDRLEHAQLDADLIKARIKSKLLGVGTGAVALGRFELLRSLGHGAAGAVYEARDPRSGAEVAVKVLRDPDVRSVARFKAEFRGLTGVVHENLAQLHELFAEGESWYFTMELVRGKPFTRYVRVSRGELEHCDPERLRTALRQLLAAVEALHAAGRLHCDLKPSNVLVTDAGRVVVLDFGLLTPTGDITFANADAVGGTPAYMAPELAAGHAPSTATDAYAVGVISFVALTGRLPTRARPAQRANELPAEAPADLTELCAALLEHDPRARMTIPEAIAALSSAPVRAHASVPPMTRAQLVGRDAELAALHRALRGVERGQSAAVFVRGVSGIGKTALVERFASEVHAPALLLCGRCYERESVPYAAFEGIVDALATLLSSLPDAERRALAPPGTTALLRIFPQLARSLAAPPDIEPMPLAPTELRSAAFAAFKELLRRLSRRAPLALIVDDLQWADLDSARLLLELLGPPDGPALLYVGCYREEEEQHSDFVREIRAHLRGDTVDAAVRFIELGPLPQRVAVELAAALLSGSHAHATEISERTAREAGGVPFVVGELVAYALQASHVLETALSLSDLLTWKIDALAADERRALALLSIAARPVARDLLEHAYDEPSIAARALRRLTVAGLVQHDARHRLIVYHDRLREHVVRHLADADGAALHRQLALAYERVPLAEPEWLIEHWRAAGEPARALESAIRAAAAAASKLAFNRSAELYRTAIALVAADDARAASLHESLGETLVNAGRSAEAAASFLVAAERSEAGAAFALRCRAAQHWLRCGRKAEASGLLELMFAQVGLRYPRREPAMIAALLVARARIAVRLRWPRVRVGRAHGRWRDRLRLFGAVFRELAIYHPLRSVLLQSWFYEHALASGDRESIFVGLSWDIYNRAFSGGDLERVRADQRELDALALQLDTPYAHATAALMRGIGAMFGGDYTHAAEHTGRALRIFREQCLGATWEESVCALTHYVVLENVGPLASLCQDAPRMVRRADERIDQLTDALLGTHMATALLCEDRPEEAAAFLRQRLARLSGEMDLMRFSLLSRLVDVQLYSNDGDAAWQTIESMWPGYRASGYDRAPFIRIFARKRRAHSALIAHRAGGDLRLLRVAHAEASELERSRRTDGLVMAAGVRAAIAHGQGDLPAARAHLRRSIAYTAQLGVAVAESCHLLALGQITPGSQGHELIARAEAALRAQGVSAPKRLARVYAGCFAP